MKDQELHIGSIYRIYQGSHPAEDRALTIEDIVDMHNHGDIGIDPIPLSEEWLLKFGFTIKPDDHFCNWLKVPVNGGWLYLGTAIGYNLTLFNSDDISLGVHCQYVHQLQNLFYSLVGEELLINKP